jgi:glutathione reductase (NADPH)
MRNGERYRGEHIVIATGGHPRVPGLPGAGLGITSDGFFELEQLPERVAMVGSGYVAVELAGVLRALGSRVSMFVRFDGVLRSVRPDAVRARARASMRGRRHRAREARRAGGVERHGPYSIELETVDGRRFEGFDALIWAIGRTPNTAGIALERAGVELRVDRVTSASTSYQNTTRRASTRVGDVTWQGGADAGRDRGRSPAGRPPVRRPAAAASSELRRDPTVIFSHPPIGTAA